MARVRVALTGATGSLGQLLLPALHEVAAAPVLAGWHQRPSPRDGHDWFRYELLSPEPFVGHAAEQQDALVLLHFACTVSNRYREILGIDCRGAERLLMALATRKVVTWLIYASSVEAVEGTPYGTGKAFAEATFNRGAGPVLTVTNVRIPVVGRRSRVPDAMPPSHFASSFITATALRENVELLRSGQRLGPPTQLVHMKA